MGTKEHFFPAKYITEGVLYQDPQCIFACKEGMQADQRPGDDIFCKHKGSNSSRWLWTRIFILSHTGTWKNYPRHQPKPLKTARPDVTSIFLVDSWLMAFLLPSVPLLFWLSNSSLNFKVYLKYHLPCKDFPIFLPTPTSPQVGRVSPTLWASSSLPHSHKPLNSYFILLYCCVLKLVTLQIVSSPIAGR